MEKVRAEGSWLDLARARYATDWRRARWKNSVVDLFEGPAWQWVIIILVAIDVLVIFAELFIIWGWIKVLLVNVLDLVVLVPVLLPC